MQNQQSQISAKELMYLEDIMDMEAQEVQKLKKAAQTATDPEAQSLLNSIAQLHQGHFQTLSNYLSQQAGR